MDPSVYASFAETQSSFDALVERQKRGRELPGKCRPGWFWNLEQSFLHGEPFFEKGRLQFPQKTRIESVLST